METQEVLAGLQDAGLTEYQAEAYLTLLEQGTAKAVDVARRCSIPAPRIYDVVEDLERMGYVETLDRDTLHVRAHEPVDVIQDLHDRSERLSDVAGAIENRWERTPLAEHDVNVAKRAETAIDHAKDLIRDADNAVELAVSRHELPTFEEALAAVDPTEVVVRLSVSPPDGEPVDGEPAGEEPAGETSADGKPTDGKPGGVETPGTEADSTGTPSPDGSAPGVLGPDAEGARAAPRGSEDRPEHGAPAGQPELASLATEVRERAFTAPFVAIVDGNTACFAPTRSLPEPFGVVVKGPYLTLQFRWFFQTCLWSVWEPVHELPQMRGTFVSLEAFVRDVYDRWESGTPVQLRVEGMDTDSGEAISVEGALADVSYTDTARTGDPPTLSDLAGECSIEVAAADHTYTVGSWGARIEDVEARRIELLAFEPPD